MKMPICNCGLSILQNPANFIARLVSTERFIDDDDLS
ncbi:Uncharacterised protein [uncultured archaeon]|nr:Uncharacterised protein [uncultured archaeon]